MSSPQRLKTEELEREAERSVVLFVQQRLDEGTRPYCEAFQKAKALVTELFHTTDNLRDMKPDVFKAVSMVDAARYLSGPPISHDDLNTLVKAHLAVAGGSKEDAIIQVLRLYLDPFRFPWLRTGAAKQKDVTTAIVWTSSLWAVERCRTTRRTESSATQERAVADLLLECGLKERQGKAPIQALDTLPRRQFTREVLLGGTKTDLAIRLPDGRLLAIECKVSNSAVNSVKRLNREAVGKAEHWRTTYGEQVIPATVLSGVFKVTNLLDAQRAGVSIFWEHALEDLGTYVRDKLV